MNDYSTKLIEVLLNGGNVDEVFRQQIEDAVNNILEAEITAFLNYEKYDVSGYNSGDSRNGGYERIIHSRFGDLHIRIPRDRNGDFSQQTVPPYKRSSDLLEQMVIKLYHLTSQPWSCCEDSNLSAIGTGFTDQPNSPTLAPDDIDSF